MNEKHINNILESTSLAGMTESDHRVVRAHISNCQACRRSYEAAQLAALLLKERNAETIEPSPFFETRVMAALRERKAETETPALLRLWRAAGSLVSSMAATVALLAFVTFVVPSTQLPAGDQDVASASNPYSAEEVIFERDGLPDDQMSYGQVLTTLYESDEDAVK
jgi:predicted anti-sigma-YlaC factor YlaD